MRDVYANDDLTEEEKSRYIGLDCEMVRCTAPKCAENCAVEMCGRESVVKEGSKCAELLANLSYWCMFC